MKPEHFKEFNVEHAQAGAPYCQRNGLAARIGIWDANSRQCLVGVKRSEFGWESHFSWDIKGIPELVETREKCTLVMLPLGMCEGKPVFVGDELINGGGRAFAVSAKTQLFSSHKWPHTAPVMPRWFDNEYDNDVLVRAMVIRPAIEAYWKALDEFNGVKE